MNTATSTRFLLLFATSILILTACKEQVVPKPRAYFRIDIPEHGFKPLESELPFTFEYADYATANTKIEDDKRWVNIHYKAHKATLYFSYFPVDSNINSLLRKEHELAYNHISKANNIDEQLILNSEKKVYGLVYNIMGSQTATPINFFMTDSIKHFIRGALYFNLPPNNDSLAPVIRSIESDIAHIVDTFEWEKDEL